jgi:hypothetical protein
MTVPAQPGVISFGIQAGKGELATDFFRHRAVSVNYGPVQDPRVFPPEVGGVLTPTGAYKGGIFMAGGFTIMPRLQNYLGYLLLATMGQVVTTPAGGVLQSHKFTFAADQAYLPWMSVRKKVPGATPLWEIGLDNLVTSARFDFPQNGILSARFDFLGRVPDWTTPPTEVYAGPYEDYPSVPITCDVDGYLQLPNTYYSTTEVPITNLSVMLANNLTTPAQEMIIGSPYPDDYVPLSRGATVQAVLKYADPQLYLDIMTGAVAGTTWAPLPFTSNLDVMIKSPGYVPTTTTKYSLRVQASTVMWNVNGSPVLSGGDIVLLPLIGTVLEPTSGDYLSFTVVNDAAPYTDYTLSSASKSASPSASVSKSPSGSASPSASASPSRSASPSA